MRRVSAPGRQKWSACRFFAKRSRRGRRRRILRGQVCWTPRSWISLTCHCSVRNCSATRWRVSIRMASQSVGARHHRRHRRHYHCCYHRRRRHYDDAKALSSTPRRLPPGRLMTLQCVVSDGALNRFTSCGSQRAKWRRLTHLDRPQPPRRKSLRPDETPTSEGSTIIITSQ